MKTLDVLKDCTVFAGLSAGELERVAALAVEKEYEAGTIIFQEGDTADDLFVLEQGKVAIQMSLPARQAGMGGRATVDLETRNDVFGWSALVEPHTYRLAALCLQNVRVLCISGAKLRQEMDANPHLGYQVLRQLARLIATRLEETREVLISERVMAPVLEGAFSR